MAKFDKQRLKQAQLANEIQLEAQSEGFGETNYPQSLYYKHKIKRMETCSSFAYSGSVYSLVGRCRFVKVEARGVRPLSAGRILPVATGSSTAHPFRLLEGWLVFLKGSTHFHSLTVVTS